MTSSSVIRATTGLMSLTLQLLNIRLPGAWSKHNHKDSKDGNNDIYKFKKEKNNKRKKRLVGPVKSKTQKKPNRATTTTTTTAKNNNNNNNLTITK